MNLKAPMSKFALHFAGYGFIDDTDIIQLGFYGDNYVEVARKLQEALK